MGCSAYLRKIFLEFYSTADAITVFVETSSFSFILKPIDTPLQSPDLSQVIVAPFSLIYRFILFFHHSMFSFYHFGLLVLSDKHTIMTLKLHSHL